MNAPAQGSPALPRRDQRFSRAVGLAVLLGLLGSHLALRTTEFFPVDDAYISFRYAENLARGEGLVFNAGERVEGYSNFLFVALLAAGSKLGITPPLAARLINIASVAFLAYILTFGAYAGGRDGPRRVHAGLGWLAGLVLVLSPHTSLNVLSGLEAPATAALLAAGVVFLSRDRPKPAAFSFLLVALSRPEGIVLALLAAGWDVWRGKEQARVRLRNWLLLLAVPYAVFFTWRVVYYGSPLPNSVQAKSGSAAGMHLERSLSYMGKAAEVYWPLMLLAVVGLVVGRRWMARAAWVALLGVMGLCLLTGSGDPYRTLIRYLYPGLPLLLMVASVSAQAWLHRASAHGRRSSGVAPEARLESVTPRGRPGAVLAVAGVTLLLAAQLAVLVYSSSFELLRTETFRAFRRVGVGEKIASGAAQIFAQDRAPHTSERLKVAIGQHDLARWLLDHAASDAVLVSSQVGIAPYYTGLKVVDTFGLVTRHIAELPGPPGAKKDPDFVFGQDPDFFAFRKPGKLIGGIPADGQLFRDPRLRRRYDLVRMFNLGGPRLLLFQRRERPIFDIRYDFVEEFSAQRVGWLDGESWRQSGAGPDRKLAIKRVQIQFSGKQNRKKLRRALEPVFRGAGADFWGAEATRRWLRQWRSWIEHRPGPEAATAIRFRVRIPESAFLRFGLGTPSEIHKRSNSGRAYAGAVRYSVLVEPDDGAPTGGGQGKPVRRQLFASTHDPGRVPGHRRPRQFEIDLRSYAQREVTFYFRAEPLAERPERGGWIEPLLVRRGPAIKERDPPGVDEEDDGAD